MDRREVMALFNKKPRIGTLSTSNKNGDVNVAVFGSPQMTDENTVVMGIGDNRSLQYLNENPKAVFIVMEPGASLAEWKGARVYLKVDVIAREGELFEQIKGRIAETISAGAAKMIRAVVQFRITDVRGIVAPV
ncbi:MAG: pyridoxamine 5'-phosphate oxidase family protein [Desulfobacterales bacterium]|jgi:hypothetical protein|nr:pyridoxamine 5'-phosphate oxidase family protein [Desulfobacterales bacterium]